MFLYKTYCFFARIGRPVTYFNVVFRFIPQTNNCATRVYLDSEQFILTRISSINIFGLFSRTEEF